MARLLIILILTSLFAFPSCSSDEEPLIAVSVFRSDDAFINDVVDWIASESHDGIPVIVGEAENSQDVQNRMISGFLDEGCSSMIINCVDRTAAGLVIEKCRKADVPLVFLNREPLKEDMAKWDRAYYVGARADVCGEMAGDPRLTPILLGLGVQELSMSPIALAPVRRIIRRMKMHDAEALAEKALDCENADESLQLSQEMVTKIAPDIVNIHKGF